MPCIQKGHAAVRAAEYAMHRVHLSWDQSDEELSSVAGVFRPDLALT